MVVSLTHKTSRSFCVGLLAWGAVSAALGGEVPSLPEIPADAKTRPPSLSGKHTLSLNQNSALLEWNGKKLPYALLTLFSADRGEIRIESEATDSVVPPAVYMYNGEGDLLTVLKASDFESKNAYLLKPDRLQASLSIHLFPRQTLHLLILPDPSPAQSFSEFDYPANQMAMAKSNPPVISGKRKVPHGSFGKIKVSVDLQSDTTASKPAVNDRMPGGALQEKDTAPVKTIVNASEETREMYRGKLRAALAQGDLDKMVELTNEARARGVEITSLNEFIAPAKTD
ncbi:MalM family protein [Kiritimatiellaeota bacterium B1221]|nr:MalM family protein [Kiritimatiellaeota bacterium B1221]